MRLGNPQRPLDRRHLLLNSYENPFKPTNLENQMINRIFTPAIMLASMKLKHQTRHTVMLTQMLYLYHFYTLTTFSS